MGLSFSRSNLKKENGERERRERERERKDYTKKFAVLD
jgi:hypothetical protein